MHLGFNHIFGYYNFLIIDLHYLLVNVMRCVTYLGISLGSVMIATILSGVCNSDEYRHLWVMSEAIDNNPMYDLTTDTCHTGKSPHGDNEACIDYIDFCQFHFLFRKSAMKGDKWLWGKEIQKFCSS